MGIKQQHATRAAAVVVALLLLLLLVAAAGGAAAQGRGRGAGYGAGGGRGSGGGGGYGGDGGGGGGGRGGGYGDHPWGGGGGNLSMDCYFMTCPHDDDIVRGVVFKALAKDPSLAASLLRLHFHDCFIRGCDASVLLDSTPAHGTAEKDALTNKSLRGFEVIDAVKAARDSVFMAGDLYYVNQFAESPDAFFDAFVQGMGRMGQLDLNPDGNVRISCSVLN